LRFSSSFCLNVFSSFLNHNQDKNQPPQPISSSDLSTLTGFSFSITGEIFSSLDLEDILSTAFGLVFSDIFLTVDEAGEDDTFGEVFGIE